MNMAEQMIKNATIFARVYKATLEALAKESIVGEEGKEAARHLAMIAAIQGDKRISDFPDPEPWKG